MKNLKRSKLKILMLIPITIFVIIGIFLYFWAGAKPYPPPTELKLASYFIPRQSLLKNAGYDTYIVEDSNEIKDFLKGEDLLSYQNDINALISFAGFGTYLQFNSEKTAKTFNANYIEIFRKENLVSYSNNKYFKDLLFHELFYTESGICLSASDNMMVLLKASSGIVSNIDIIGYRAFVDTTFVTVTVDGRLKEIDNQAFYNHKFIKKFLYLRENNITKLGNMAFYNCAALESFDGMSLNTIGNYSFKGCETITQIKLGQINMMGNGVFVDTSSLKKIDEISGNYIFEKEAIYSSDKKTIIKSFISESTIELPEAVENIGYGAFSKNLKLKTIKLGNNVKKIGDTAFANCINLASINLENVIIIGDDALINTKIANIKLSNNIKKIGADAFRYTLISEIEIPNSIESIGNRAFKDVSALRKIVLKSVTPFEIGKDVFNGIYRLFVSDLVAYKNCYDEYYNNIYSINDIVGDFAYKEIDGGLEIVQYLGKQQEVQIPSWESGKKVISLGDNSFYQLHHVSKVSAAFNNLVSVGNSAFDGCSGLTSVEFSAGLTTIGNNAFRNCAKLTNIIAPDSLIKIGMYAFDNTVWLKSQGDFAILGNVLYKYQGAATIVTTPNVKYIGNRAFALNNKVTEVTVQEGTLGLDDNAFYYCENLTNINLPDSLKTIASQVFMGANKINTFTLPKNIEYIGYGAFIKTHAEKIIMLGEIPCNMGLDVFIYPQNPNFKIVVSGLAFCNAKDGSCEHNGGAKHCYKHAPKWLAYKSKMEAII